MATVVIPVVRATRSKGHFSKNSADSGMIFGDGVVWGANNSFRLTVFG